MRVAQLRYPRPTGMQLHRSRTALVTTLLLAGAATGAAFVACAQGGSGSSALPLGDASTESGSGSLYDASSSSGSSSGSGGGGCDADTQTDRTNCGSCGNRCATGDICNVGECQEPCASPEVECQGQPGCFDLTSDMQNCGTCGSACTPPAGGTVTGTAACTKSQCVFTCPTDAGVPEGGGPIVQCEADSGGSVGCFDLTSTSDHCGACGTQCPTGNICTESQCCPSGNAYCGGKCVDVSTDPNNCGACGASCPAPAQCTAGKCTGYTTSKPTLPFLDACAMTGATSFKNEGTGRRRSLTALPFRFTFYGTAQTQFWLQNQGTMAFGDGDDSRRRMSYPDCTEGRRPDDEVPGRWSPSAMRRSPLDRAGVCYATTGTAPSQQLRRHVEAGDRSVRSRARSLTFSIVLTQTTNTIDFMYETMAGGPTGGSIRRLRGRRRPLACRRRRAPTLVSTAVSCATVLPEDRPVRHPLHACPVRRGLPHGAASA